MISVSALVGGIVPGFKMWFGSTSKGATTAEGAAQPLRLRGGGEKKTKFPWGDNSFEPKVLPYCLLWGGLLVATAVTVTPLSGPNTSPKGPIAITLLWLWAYYQCIGAQIAVGTSAAKTAAQAVTDGKDHGQAQKVAERCTMNTLEQGVPFLTTMWLMATYVDTAMATSIGGVYIFLRTLFPIAYSYYGEFSMLQEFITVPNYMCVHHFIANLLAFILGYPPLAQVVGQNFLMWLVGTIVYQIICLQILWNYPMSAVAVKLNVAANAKRD